MTIEQADILQKRHEQLLKAATKFLQADARRQQYPGNRDYSNETKVLKHQLQKIVREQNIAKANSELVFT